MFGGLIEGTEPADAAALPTVAPYSPIVCALAMGAKANETAAANAIANTNVMSALALGMRLFPPEARLKQTP